jgi:hypothetical protein
MNRRMRWLWMAATLLLGLLLPRVAVASEYLDGCPKPCYSCKHYWAPSMWRVHSCLFCPKMNTYAPNRHPEIPPTFRAVQFRCQPVGAQQSSVDFYFAR